MSTSSASRSRASATAAPIGAHPACTSCQARTQVWKFSGWTSAIASEIERGSAVSRNRAGTFATAAGLTTANPFWAAIACAGRRDEVVDQLVRGVDVLGLRGDPEPADPRQRALLRRHPLDRLALGLQLQRVVASAVGEHYLAALEQIQLLGVGAGEAAELGALVDQLLLRGLDLLVGQRHRVGDPLGHRRLGDWGQPGAAVDRDAPGVRGVVERRPTSRARGEDLLGVVEQALRAGGHRDEVDRAVVALDPLVVAERELVPALDRTRVDRPQQAAGSRSGWYSSEQTLTTSALEAAGELRGALLDAVEGRRLEVEVGVLGSRNGSRITSLAVSL